MGVSKWLVAGASVRGAGHERLGLPCQDAHCWTILRGGLFVAAVSDGAGSAPLADVGAKLAAEAAVEHVRKGIERAQPSLADDEWGSVLTGALASARLALEREAEIRSIPVANLATTLIILAAGPGFVAASQVGDGAVIAVDRSGTMRAITRPEPAEYLNETVFLTSAEALGKVQPRVWRGELAHVGVLSDGLQMAALQMPAGEPHAGFFSPLFSFLAQQTDLQAAQQALADFLGSARVRARTDDDVTLLLGSLSTD